MLRYWSLRLFVVLGIVFIAAVALAACGGTEETDAGQTDDEVAHTDDEVAHTDDEVAHDDDEVAHDDDDLETPVGAAEEQAEPASGDVLAEGQDLYVSAGCGACHGPSGEGSAIGPALPGHTAEQVERQIRTPLATMPSYSLSQLSDEDVTKIAAFIESLAGAETHVEPLDLPELLAMHHWMALSAIQSENVDDALHHVEHIIGEVEGDHLLAMEEVAEHLRTGEGHEAEHLVEGMLAGTAKPNLTLKQLHLELALAAVGNRNDEEASHHVSHFVELATGEEKASGELIIAQLEAGNLHDAEHDIEAMLGIEVHG